MEKKCLICDKKVRLTRGLCNTHYSEYSRGKLSLEEDQQDDFEELCIREGRLLPSRHTGRRKQGAFGDLLERIRNESADKEAAEIQDAIDSNESKPITKKTTKKKGA